MRGRFVIVALMMVTACQAKETSGGSTVDPGGCTIIKQAPTGEYATAVLSKFGSDQDQVCQHIVEGWNSDPYLSGTSAHFRCSCPAYQPPR